jgi:hypothetical protein
LRALLVGLGWKKDIALGGKINGDHLAVESDIKDGVLIVRKPNK